MTDQIQRLWMMNNWEVGDGSWPVEDPAEPDDLLYILATPEALAALPEVQALIAAEREACAAVALSTPSGKVTDEFVKKLQSFSLPSVWLSAADNHSVAVAAAIRNRKDTTPAP